MHPGDENGAVILDERMAQAKAKRNSFAMGMLISAAAGIFGLILTAIIADSVSVSLIVAVIAAALVGFCGKQQLKYAREFQKRIRMKKRWVSRQEKLRCSKENLRQDYDEKETELCNLKEEYREYEEKFFSAYIGRAGSTGSEYGDGNHRENVRKYSSSGGTKSCRYVLLRF